MYFKLFIINLLYCIKHTELRRNIERNCFFLKLNFYLSIGIDFFIRVIKIMSLIINYDEKAKSIFLLMQIYTFLQR